MHNSRLQVGAFVEIFDADTTTKRTVYKDAALSIEHSQPILTNASGRIPVIFTSGVAYKARISTPAGVVIEEINGIPGDVSSSVVSGGSGADLLTGDVIWAYRTASRTNFVRCNGRTIGSALSGATERANADCQALFEHLWTVDAALAVSGGRGGTANADWLLNKAISVPDLRGRTLVGLDDMGSSAAGRLNGGTFVAGSATVLGSALGTATETLTLLQIPGHSHTGTTSSYLGHSHTGTTAGAGAFTPSGTLATAGLHNHGSTTNAGSHAHTTDSQGLHNHGITTTNAGSHSHTTDSQGLHNHAASSGNAGAHTPAGSVSVTVNANGDHSHTGTTDSAGSHSHTWASPSTRTAIAQGAVSGYWNGTGTPEATSTDGAHTHTFTTATTGSHTHTASGSFVGTAVGDHTHTITILNDGAHTHTVSTVGDHAHTILNDGSHTHTVSTVGDHAHAILNDGDHTHAFTGDAVASHQHTFGTDTAGAHDHTFTSALSGGGLAHNNLSPGVVGTWFMRL